MSVPAYDHRLVTENDRLVRWVAKRFRGFDSMDDLMQQGRIGLMLAAQSFDPTRGTKFSSYAVAAIRTHIYRWLTNNVGDIRKGAKRLRTDKTPVRLVEFEHGRHDVPVQSEPEDNDITDMRERAEQARPHLIRMLQRVPGQRENAERYVDWLYRRLRGETLAQIGKSEGVSKQRVHQTQQEVIRLLKAHLRGAA